MERRCLAYEPSLPQVLVRPHGAGFVAGHSSTLPVCFMNRRMPNGTSAWCGRTAGVIPPPTRLVNHHPSTLTEVLPYRLLETVSRSFLVFHPARCLCASLLLVLAAPAVAQTRDMGHPKFFGAWASCELLWEHPFGRQRKQQDEDSLCRRSRGSACLQSGRLRPNGGRVWANAGRSPAVQSRAHDRFTVGGSRDCGDGPGGDSYFVHGRRR